MNKPYHCFPHAHEIDPAAKFCTVCNFPLEALVFVPRFDRPLTPGPCPRSEANPPMNRKLRWGDIMPLFRKLGYEN